MAQPNRADYDFAHTNAALFDASQRGVIEVVGVDARAFLHNLCTNDIKSLKPGNGCEIFLATAQARAVAYGIITSIATDGPESFRLDLDPGLAEKVVKHLDRYIISEQVELADRTAEFAWLHVAGPGSRDLLTRAAGTSSIAQTPLLVVSGVELAAVACQVRSRDPLGVAGYDVMVHSAGVSAVRQALLDAGAHLATPETFEILRVEAGTPVYGRDIDDNRLVMEVGRTAQAISYTKGCYLGQEPIVMARDRGHVNRTLLGVRASGDSPLPHDTKLFRDGKEVGQTTASVISPRFGSIALAYIRRGNQEPGTVLEFDTGAVKGTAVVTGLPFSG
jgi:folate-binding protein YgfZ